MLYKQAWQELKAYIKTVKVTTTSWDSPEESAMRDKILDKIEQLENKKELRNMLKESYNRIERLNMRYKNAMRRENRIKNELDKEFIKRKNEN